MCQPLLPASVSPSNLLKVYSIPPFRSLLKILKSRTNPWETPLVTGLQLDSATLIIHLRSTSQPVSSPSHCPLVYPILPKFIWEYVMWDDVKRLHEIKVHDIHCSPLIYPSGHGRLPHSSSMISPCWIQAHYSWISSSYVNLYDVCIQALQRRKRSRECRFILRDARNLPVAIHTLEMAGFLVLETSCLRGTGNQSLKYSTFLFNKESPATNTQCFFLQPVSTTGCQYFPVVFHMKTISFCML